MPGFLQPKYRVWSLFFLCALVVVVKMATPQGEVESLQAQLKQLRADFAAAQGSQSVVAAAPVYVTTRKVDRFKDRPEKSGDPSVEDWVADMRSYLLARNLSGKAGAACIKEHLTGKARLEISGRGDDSDPEAILSTLLRVFGDGDLLPQLQQKFYSYTQQEGEDLVACSLHLLRLFERIATLDSAFQPCKVSLLKGRLAESVSDEGLKRELRRLNVECPDLGFFDVRDRALQWLGGDVARGKAKVSISETLRKESIMEEALRKQGEMLERQQKAIETILARMSSGEGASPTQGARRPFVSGQRRCWTCGSHDHLKRGCPQNSSPQDQGN